MGMKKRSEQNKQSRGVYLSFAIIYITLFVLFSSEVLADDWPMFRHDPAHTGYTIDELGDQPELLWSFKAGGKIYNSPIISNGNVIFYSKDNNVYCLDEDTGHLIWRRRTGGHCYLAADRDKLFMIGPGKNGIRCLNKNTGELIWKRKVRASSPPVIVNKKIFMNFDCGESKTPSGTCCLDEDTGKLIWSTKLMGNIWTPESSPAVKDGKIFVCSTETMYGRLYGRSGGVFCLNERTGEQILHYTTRQYRIQEIIKMRKKGIRFSHGQFRSSAVLTNNTLIAICSDGMLHCLDKDSGRLLWNSQIEVTCDAHPSIANGKIYVSGDNVIYCLGGRDLKSIVWKSKIEGSFVFTSPIVAGGRVICISDDGKIFSLDANTGKLYWISKVKGPIRSGPVVANNKLFVCSLDGTIWCFKSKTDTLFINSTPSGTEVYLSGIKKGTTPLEIKSFPVGNYLLKVSKPGYKNYEGKIHISHAKTTKLPMITLTRVYLKIIPKPILKVAIIVFLNMLIMFVIVGLIFHFRKPKIYRPVEEGYKKERR